MEESKMKDAEKIINAVNKYFDVKFDIEEVVHHMYAFAIFFRENVLYELLGNPYGTVNSEDAAEFMMDFEKKTGFNLVEEFSRMSNSFIQMILTYNDAFGIWD